MNVFQLSWMVIIKETTFGKRQFTTTGQMSSHFYSFTKFNKSFAKHFCKPGDMSLLRVCVIFSTTVGWCEINSWAPHYSIPSSQIHMDLWNILRLVSILPVAAVATRWAKRWSWGIGDLFFWSRPANCLLILFFGEFLWQYSIWWSKCSISN
jgi:hypothetical protein